jgi:hypothetical protein
MPGLRSLAKKQESDLVNIQASPKARITGEGRVENDIDPALEIPW